MGKPIVEVFNCKFANNTRLFAFYNATGKKLYRGDSVIVHTQFGACIVTVIEKFDLMPSFEVTACIIDVIDNDYYKLQSDEFIKQIKSRVDSQKTLLKL